AFNLCAGAGRDLVENLAEVGVGRLDAQSLAVPCDRGLFGGFVGGPLGWFGDLRCRGYGINRGSRGGVTGARTVRPRGMGGRLRGSEDAAQRDGEAGKAQEFRTAAAQGGASDLVGCGVTHKGKVCDGLESPRLSMY